MFISQISKPRLRQLGLWSLILCFGLAAIGSANGVADSTVSSVIACRVMEVGTSRPFGISIAIFHYRDAAERDQLGTFLRRYDGTTVEFQAKNSAWQRATLLRLKTCFGRGLLIFPVSEAHLARGDELMLRVPREASQQEL
jgi:hypothetical protein